MRSPAPRPPLPQLIVFEDDSIAKIHIGSWSDYETRMREMFGSDLTPHRVNYLMVKR